MAAVTTGTVTLPKRIVEPWIQKIQGGSVIAKLSQNRPQIFGDGEALIFDSGEAELVREGQPKNSADVTVIKHQVTNLTFQKTIRVSNQLTWADQTQRLAIIDRILESLTRSFPRALDIAVLHGLNPATKQLDTEAQRVALVGAPEHDVADLASIISDITAAEGLVYGKGYAPKHLALGYPAAAAIRALRDRDGLRLYGDFAPYSETPSLLDGFTATASDVVNFDSETLAFVGDFSAIQWGVAVDLGLEKIEFGDPDGLGDLKRLNQVAYRAEVSYGIGVADKEAFVRLKNV